jgi:hypothetical protein
MNLSKENIDDFYVYFLSNVKGFNGIIKEGGVNTASITTDDGDATLSFINKNTGFYLNNFIENELNLNPKVVNRNVIMFESEIKPNCLIIRW